MPSQQKLQEILARENNKKGPIGARAPALCRETALDTHKTAACYDFGPSPDRMDLIEQHRSEVRSTQLLPSQQMRSKDRRASVPIELPASLSGRHGEIRSVFKPAPHQEHVCAMATKRRQNVKNSEWALIETLEVDLHNKSKEKKREMDAARARKYREVLDDQMRIKAEHAMAEAETRMREGAELEAAVAAFKEEEKLKLDALKERNHRLRAETVQMVQAAKEAKAAQILSMKEREAAFLRECQEKMAEEDAIKEAKMLQHKAQKEQTQKENLLRLKERKEAEMKQKEKDNALMKAAIEHAEKLDKEREESRRAKEEAAAAKLQRALTHPGMQQAAQMQALQDAWIKKAQEEEERKAQEKDLELRTKRERMKSELIQAHSDFLENRKRQQEVERAEIEAMRKSCTAAALAEHEFQTHRVTALRKKNTDNRMFLSMQMEHKEKRSLVDDVGMSERERQMNLKLLNHAVRQVGPQPKQLTADFS